MDLVCPHCACVFSWIGHYAGPAGVFQHPGRLIFSQCGATCPHCDFRGSAPDVHTEPGGSPYIKEYPGGFRLDLRGLHAAYLALDAGAPLAQVIPRLPPWLLRILEDVQSDLVSRVLTVIIGVILGAAGCHPDEPSSASAPRQTLDVKLPLGER